MERKAVSGIMLTLLLIGMLTLAFNIQSPTASSSIKTESTQTALKYEATSGNETKPQGGTLRIGTHYSGEPGEPEKDLNPYRYPGSAIYFPLFSKIVRLDENCSITPDLAWNWTQSPDGLEWRFRLISNATFHDGSSVNSSAVKGTIDMILTNPQVHWYWTEYFGLRDSIKNVTIIGAYTFDIHMKQVFNGLLYSLVYIPIVPINATNLSAENPFNSHPIGSGPFEFVKWTPGINITLKAYDDYWRGRPNLDGLTYRWDIPMQELADMLKINEIDLVPYNIDPYKVEELQRMSGVSVTITDNLDIVSIWPNLNNEILNNTEVRIAMRRSLNITEIIETDFLGYATPANGPIPPAMKQWYYPDITKYDYNPALASETLDNEGYSINETTGWRFNVTLEVTEELGPSLLNLSKSIKKYFENIGIGVKIQNESLAELAYNIATYNYTLALIPIIFETMDPNLNYEVFHTDGVYNGFNYSNPQVDSILEQMRATTNETEKQILCYQFQDIIATEQVNIFISQTKRINVHNNDFHGFIVTSSIYSTDEASLENVYYEETVSGQGRSPVKVCFIDEQGRRTGFFNGSVLEQIPDSIYDEEFSVVKIRSPGGNYTVEVTGTGNGTYSLEIVSIALDYKYVEVALNTIRVNQTRTYLVQVFPDGKVKVWNPLLDIYEDWKINMRDLTSVAVSFGSSPGDPRWNKAVDIYEDDKVNIRDLTMVAKHFGKVWP